MFQLNNVQQSCQPWTSASTGALFDARLALKEVPSPCCSFKDKEVQRDSKLVSYDVVDKKGKPYVSVDVAGESKVFSPEEISAMILTKMKDTAGGYGAGRAGWQCLGACLAPQTAARKAAFVNCLCEHHNFAKASGAEPLASTTGPFSSRESPSVSLKRALGLCAHSGTSACGGMAHNSTGD